MASFVEDYDNSWRKARKVEWMIKNVGEEPSRDILDDANRLGWLCSGKNGLNGWTDFKTTGLDAIYLTLQDDDGVVEGGEGGEEGAEG